MSKINFPQLFGSILQFNVTQLLNVVAEQEVEKDQLNHLVVQLKDGEVQASQIEINKQTGEIRVAMAPPSTESVSLGNATQEELAHKLAELISLGAPVASFEQQLDRIKELPDDAEEVEYKEFNTPDLDEPPDNINYQKPE